MFRSGSLVGETGCTDIFIINDNSVEMTEFFIVYAIAPCAEFLRNQALVIILDDDGMSKATYFGLICQLSLDNSHTLITAPTSLEFSFTSDAYTINEEAGVAEVCVELTSGTLVSDANVTISIQPITTGCK